MGYVISAILSTVVPFILPIFFLVSVFHKPKQKSNSGIVEKEKE